MVRVLEAGLELGVIDHCEDTSSFFSDTDEVSTSIASTTVSPEDDLEDEIEHIREKLAEVIADNVQKMETNKQMKRQVEELKDVLLERDEHQYDYVRELEMKDKDNRQLHNEYTQNREAIVELERTLLSRYGRFKAGASHPFGIHPTWLNMKEGCSNTDIQSLCDPSSEDIDSLARNVRHLELRNRQLRRELAKARTAEAEPCDNGPIPSFIKDKASIEELKQLQSELRSLSKINEHWSKSQEELEARLAEARRWEDTASCLVLQQRAKIIKLDRELFQLETRQNHLKVVNKHLAWQIERVEEALKDTSKIHFDLTNYV